MKEEDYSKGDLLTKSAAYSANYPGWKVERGIVISSKKRLVSDQSLAATDRASYRGRYGAQVQYPIFEIVLSTASGNYLVSQFGFNKDAG